MRDPSTSRPSIDQLFEPHVRLFLARLDGVAVFDDYADVKRMYTQPAARGRELRRLFST
jgi:hypothetical protein